MMREDKSYPGCHFNHPDNFPKLKFHQEVGCPALDKHGYIFRKDVTASDKIVDRFNTKFPRMTDQARVNNPIAKRILDDSSSNHIPSKHVRSPSISNTIIDSTVPPAPISNTNILMPNRAVPTPTSNGYNNLYSSESDDDPVFEEIVDSNYIKPINTYILVPPNLTIVSTPTKALNKKRKIRGRTRLTTIKQAQSDKTASARFLSTSLHSVSQAITRANSHRIAIYNNKDTACCADSGASEEMFLD